MKEMGFDPLRWGHMPMLNDVWLARMIMIT
jgi:hypothetical protein